MLKYRHWFLGISTTLNGINEENLICYQNICYAVKLLTEITFKTKLHSVTSEMHKMMYCIPLQTPVLLYESEVRECLNYIGMLTW